jgi:hypothetical protein
MFESDLRELPTADLLESAAEHRALATRCEARVLEHAQVYADRFHPDACAVRPRPGRRSCGGRERAVVLGGEGCPEIAEFAIAEFGVLLGVSSGVAARLIGEALALRHRFPLTWARVLSGAATPWKAQQIVAACMTLSEEAAARVDRRVAGLVDSITPYRLEKIVKAARAHADPDRARAEAEEKARERGVFVGTSDEHGTKSALIKASSGAVIRFDARIDAIADALKVFGDARKLQHRRAEAVDIISDARYTEELLAQAREFQHTPHPSPAHPSPAQPAPDPTPANTPAPAPATDPATEPVTERATGPATGPAAEPTLECATRPDLDDLPPGVAPASIVGVPARGGLTLDDVPEAFDVRYPESLDLTDPFGPFASHPRAGTGRDVDADDKGEDDCDSDGLDAAAPRELDARLAQIKRDAYADLSNRGQVRPGQTEIYVHLTDHTLATGTGVLRAETVGPLLASQLTELIGHGPYTVKPVIDLNDAVSVNAYEIPTRIRERVRLLHPVELFPYGTRETSRTIDLDHIEPYDPLGPPGQTSTTNLAPLSRFGHRVKTHARGWNVRRLDHKTLEWTTPHGFVFEVGPAGTHRVPGNGGPPSSG